MNFRLKWGFPHFISSKDGKMMTGSLGSGLYRAAVWDGEVLNMSNSVSVKNGDPFLESQMAKRMGSGVAWGY